MADFPAALPYPKQSGYSYSPRTQAVRTTMSDGHVKARRRFTTAPAEFNVVWNFTDSEFDTFQAWYENSINAGVSTFGISLKSGDTVSSLTAMFLEEWTAKMLTCDLWEVSAKLLVTDRPVGSYP